MCYSNLRTVEWTGGGEPTLHPEINEIIEQADAFGLEQGMITNGVALTKNVTKESLAMLKWLRISINSLEYIDEINIPKIKGTLGFSYVINEKTDWSKSRIQDYVDKYKPAYVRIVPNCLATFDEHKINNENYSELIEKMGPPYFYQRKEFEQPKHCWWGYLKPFAHHDGWVYPCSSVVLNSGADGKFHEHFRWVKIEDLYKLYYDEMEPFPTNQCDHCVFKRQNDQVDSLLNPTGMENFV
uniref:Uncharacterized protein n=1 Tax=viral metagenome TaxID=1070528 RepID=A0A6M3K621_9ZZZZ